MELQRGMLGGCDQGCPLWGEPLEGENSVPQNSSPGHDEIFERLRNTTLDPLVNVDLKSPAIVGVANLQHIGEGLV